MEHTLFLFLTEIGKLSIIEIIIIWHTLYLFQKDVGFNQLLFDFYADNGCLRLCQYDLIRHLKYNLLSRKF